MVKNKVFPKGLMLRTQPKGSLLPKGGLGGVFKRFVNNMITLFDEPHEKLLFNIILIMIFSAVYKLIDNLDRKAFSKRLDTGDAIYFASITNFTLGFGDIIPQSTLARVAVIVHSLMFWMVAIA